jgi:hypothetical protein
VQVGRCISFGGSEWAVLPSLQLGAQPAASISFWYKSEGDDDVLWPMVFDMAFMEEPEEFDSNVLFTRVRRSTDAVFQVILDGQLESEQEFADEWIENTWIHYVWVLKKTSDEDGPLRGDWLFYRNGVLVGETTGSYPRHTLNSNFLGKGHWPEDDPFMGKIDSFAVFPYALTQQHIYTLYAVDESPVAVSVSPPVVHYSLTRTILLPDYFRHQDACFISKALYSLLSLLFH